MQASKIQIQYILQNALKGHSACTLNFCTIRYTYCPQAKHFGPPLHLVPDMKPIIEHLQSIFPCKMIYNSSDGTLLIFFKESDQA